MRKFNDYLDTIYENASIPRGFFDMDFIRQIETMSLPLAKEKITSRVLGSNAKEKNKIKALKMVEKSNSIKKLMIGLTSFMLAHTDEDLGMSKGT